MTSDVSGRCAQPQRPPFGTWLLQQKTRDGLVEQLAEAGYPVLPLVASDVPKCGGRTSHRLRTPSSSLTGSGG